jgi:signal transduction histidine kinase
MAVVTEQPSGIRAVVSVNVEPLHDHQGRRVGAINVFEDITERMRADQALRESAERLQTLSRRLLEVQEVERRHLARELHDEIGQMLTSLRLQLNWTGEVAPDAVRRRFESAQSMIEELLEKVRRLSFDLRPAELDQLGLLPALIALFERSTDQMGVRIDLKHQGLERRFASEVETTAYRIIQESLTNVARHAGVAEAIVRVWTTSDTLDVQIEDHGRGFDPQVILGAPRSIGLAGMRERVELLSGRLTIEARPGVGTLITAELPAKEQTPWESKSRE